MTGRKQRNTPTMAPSTFIRAGLGLIACLCLSRCQPNPYREGERLYKANCANCHMDNGEGLGALIPPLAGVDYLKTHREKLACLLVHGLEDTISVNGRTYVEKMPGVPTLTDIQVTNILNYINTSWGNDNEPFQLDEVRESLKNCAQ